MSVSEGTFGRSPDRSGRYPNGMFKQNRENFSYLEMVNRTKMPGDLFAVFQDDVGEVWVEYSREEDYWDFAFQQIEQSLRYQPRALTKEDAYLLIGCTMISRIHPYDFMGFIHLLDYKMRPLFDMRRLIEWSNINKSFFASPAEDAVLADAEDPAGMYEEYSKLEGVR